VQDAAAGGILHALKGEEEIPALVVALVLDLRGVEVKARLGAGAGAGQIHRHGAHEGVGFHIVKVLRFPRERDICAIGVDALVGALEGGQVAKVDCAAFAEVFGEEGVQFVKEFFAEAGILRGALFDAIHQFAPDVLKILVLHAHEVDEAGIAIHLCAGEQVFECAEK